MKSSFKSQLSKLILRGPVLDQWISRKMKLLESRYSQELLKASTGKRAVETPPHFQSSKSLKRLLFISDINWEHKELVPELENICSVRVLNLRDVLKPRGRGPGADLVEAALQEFIRSNGHYEPDVILFYARSNLLSEAIFEMLRKCWNCPLLGMNLDDKIEFLDYSLFSDTCDNYQRWAKFFDLNITNVRAVVDWYSDRGLPVYYMPEGFHPKNNFPEHGAYKYEISFVGQWKPEREIFFRHLKEYGVPIEPVGFGWPNSSAGNNPEAVYRSSMINLGIGFASPSKVLTTLKTRDFECPGSGACYMTTYNWELALHYEIGKEILCYRSLEEIVELFSYYRRRPEECLKIAQAAYRRCLNEHTWEKRFRRLFAEIGLAK